MAIRVRSTRGFRRRQSRNHFVGLAAICVTILLAARWVGGAAPLTVVDEQRVFVAEFDTVDLPAPSAYVPAGTKAGDIDFKSIAYPRHQIPPGVVWHLDEIQGTTTIAALPASLPLFRKNFSTTAGALNPVVERIPVGMRAITIRVDATSAVEGWAGSGSYVDVLLITKDQSLVVAEKVRILSAERSTLPVQDGSPVVPSTVTLLVSQEQALAISTAVPLGRLAFALRNVADDAEWSRTVYTAGHLDRSQRHSPKTGNINGLLAVGQGGERKAYALSDGRWIQTEEIPEGFRLGEK